MRSVPINSPNIIQSEFYLVDNLTIPQDKDKIYKVGENFSILLIALYEPLNKNLVEIWIY